MEDYTKMEEKDLPLQLQDVKDAQERIRGHVVRTPLLRTEELDEALGCTMYVKPEMLQVTGAFKARGAFNKVLKLTDEERKRGIIFSSSGNHAAACAYVAKQFGIDAYAVIPEDTPKGKIENCERRGGHVILWERDYRSRMKKVEDEIAEHGYTLVHGFDDYDVMAGQGTIGLEVLEDCPDLDAIVVPIGGGGLISGISTAIKGIHPETRVIGVQAAASCGYYESKKTGKMERVVTRPTIADGIECTYPTENPFPIVMKRVDEIVTVEEEDIMKACALIGSGAHLVAEPTSSVVVAALLEKKINVRSEDKVCCVLTSGNYDIDQIGSLYQGQMVEAVD